MTSLVKNELIKIFHKKGLLFLCIVVVLFSVLIVVTTRYEDRIESKVENLINNAICSEDIDLNDPDVDLTSNISMKVECEISKYKNKYDRDSEQYYYLTHSLSEVLGQAYTAKYISHDDETYNMLMNQFNEDLKNIDHIDWLAKIKEDRDEKELELVELKKTSNNSNSSEIRALENELYVLNYRLEHKITYTEKDSSELLDEMLLIGAEYATYNEDESSYENYSDLAHKREAEKSYFITKYQLEHEMFNTDSKSIANDLFETFHSFSIFVLFAMLVVIGGIVAEEFNKGTIKQLLVKPFTRNKILLSKIIAGLITIFGFYVFYVLVNILQGIAAYGNIKSLFDPILIYSIGSGKVVELNLIQGLGLNFISLLPKFLIIYMFVFAIGVISTNTASTVVFGFAFYFVADLLTELLVIPGKIASWIFYYCWDFEQYISGVLPFYGNFELLRHSSLLKNSMVCILTLALLVFISFFVFKKKDIKNQ